MPVFKLIYFERVRARAELSRLLLVASGEDFDDIRLDSVKEWTNIKPSSRIPTPFGQLPVLEVDGKVLAQSTAIARYLARELEFAGKDSWEQAQCDQYIELIEELYDETFETFHVKDEEVKLKEVYRHLAEEVYPKYLKLNEQALERNGGRYFVGDTITVADLAVYAGFDFPLKGNDKLMDAFPKLKEHRTRIEALPKLHEYIRNRKPAII